VNPAAALADALDDALPQTQCTRCGYPDCRSYAEAIAHGEAEINQCPPGGAEGIVRLARLTGRPALPLNPSNGHEGPRQLAVIDEAWCIGCTLCLKVCPTDAIVGGAKRMHTVIDPLCTGCELCIPVCPVDCISLVNVTGARTGWQAWTAPEAAEAKQRYAFHRHRLQRDAEERSARLAARAQAQLETSAPVEDSAAPVATAESKQSRIAAARGRS
jgi:Na+-translocating ferredoxin:NAD+ oxidoreductase subunit B